MLITVDIGNSNINISVFSLEDIEKGLEQVKPYNKFQLSSVETKTADEYSLMIYNIFKINNVDLKSIKGAVMCSVVPQLTPVIYSALKKISPAFIYLVGAGMKTGINIEASSEIGSDIVANAVASVNLYSYPLVVIDFGTATTVTLVDENKSLKGVAIMPGFMLSLNSLANGTALLNHVSTKNLKAPIVGKTSEDSIKSGVLRSFCYSVDGFLDNIKKEYGFEKLTAVATGYYSHFVVPSCENWIAENENLTAIGLLKLFFLNRRI